MTTNWEVKGEIEKRFESELWQLIGTSVARERIAKVQQRASLTVS